jgi:hypothetical protein
MTDYICNYCFKSYKHRQSLFTHKKKCKILHNERIYKNTDATTKKHNFPQKTTILSQFSTKNHTFANTKSKNTVNDNKSHLMCKYCCKYLSRVDSLHRHLKTCRKKKEYELELYSKDEVMKEVLKGKEEILELINKTYKIHPKTFKKMQRDLQNINISNSNNSTTNTVNNTTNTTNIQNNIQQHINIIPLGKEDFINTLDKETQLSIIKKYNGCIKYFLDVTHFNPDTPQYRSFAITNTQNNIAYMYNDDSKSFDATSKADLLFNIIHERGCDIRDMIELNKDTLKPITINKVNTYIDKLDTDQVYHKKESNTLKVKIYNNTKTFDSNYSNNFLTL